jgi:hypothetical protein
LLRLDYERRASKQYKERGIPQLFEVEMQVTEGVKRLDPPGSITTPYFIRGKVVKGEIPKHPSSKEVRLRLYHGWTDVLVTKDGVVTLRFTADGQLFDIKEFEPPELPQKGSPENGAERKAIGPGN